MAYDNTTVPVEKSQGEIRKLLSQFGHRFQFGEGTGLDGRRWAGFSFRHNDHHVLMQVPLKPVDPKVVEARARRARTKTRSDIEFEEAEQELRRIWRVLYWSLKSRMVAIEEEVEEFEQAFLAHLVDPRTGATLWNHLQPAITAGAFKPSGQGLTAIAAIGSGS